MTTDFRCDQAMFCIFKQLFFMSTQCANQLISVPQRKRELALDNLLCSIPEVEGWVWSSSWQVAGVSQPSDLNSICPHAKGMNSSEGEWHLAHDNHAHAQNIHTRSAQHRKHSWTCLEIAPVCNAVPVALLSITLRGPGLSAVSLTHL